MDYAIELADIIRTFAIPADIQVFYICLKIFLVYQIINIFKYFKYFSIAVFISVSDNAIFSYFFYQSIFSVNIFL